MTSPYPPYQPPRKLERSRSNRVLGGVCGGIADYVNMDPTLVRILTVVISLFTGVPIVLYLIALFVIPEEDSTPPGPSVYPPVSGPQSNYGASPSGWESQAPQQQTYAPSPSPQASPSPPPWSSKAPAEPDVWGVAGAPWEQSADGARDRTQPSLDDPGPEPEAPSRGPSTP